MSDQDLVEGCLKGKMSHQELLYKRFSSKMMGVCLRYFKDRQEAEDALQEAFIRVFDHIKYFRFEAPLEAWVRRITVNTAISLYNRNKKYQGASDLEEVQNEVSASYESALSKLEARDLLSLINLLPPGYRMVFNLFAIEGYQHKEIASMLDISENTSKTQYQKARKYLQRELAKLQMGKYEQ